MNTNFIPDGYTVPGYIAESTEAPTHGACRFVYRPGLPEENGVVLESGLAPEVREQRYRKFLAAHVKEWDISNPLTNAPIPIDEKHIGRINPYLRSKMVDVICGYAESDPLPSGDTLPRPDAEANSGN